MLAIQRLFDEVTILEHFRTEFTPDPKANSEDNWRQMIFDILQTVAISVILFLGINLVTARIRIESVSMENPPNHPPLSSSPQDRPHNAQPSHR